MAFTGGSLEAGWVSMVLSVSSRLQLSPCCSLPSVCGLRPSINFPLDLWVAATDKRGHLHPRQVHVPLGREKELLPETLLEECGKLAQKSPANFF